MDVVENNLPKFHTLSSSINVEEKHSIYNVESNKDATRTAIELKEPLLDSYCNFWQQILSFAKCQCIFNQRLRPQVEEFQFDCDFKMILISNPLGVRLLAFTGFYKLDLDNIHNFWGLNQGGIGRGGRGPQFFFWGGGVCP